jgi:hypothetical protein
MTEMTEDIATALSQELFSDEGLCVYAVLDGASVPELLPRLEELQPEYECLYRGELAPDMAEVAPYLVRLEADSEFAAWLLDGGWGKHWGVFATSEEDLRAVHRHLRKFLTVYDPDGKPMLFRYYDPRVMRLYLPTCNAEELATIFGPILCYTLEGEDALTLLRFRLGDGKLQQERKPLDPEAEARDAQA